MNTTRRPLTTFKLTIEVTVETNTDGATIAPLVNDALAELTNRRDFKGGLLRPGRVIDFSTDFQDTRVTVDLSSMNIRAGGDL